MVLILFYMVVCNPNFDVIFVCKVGSWWL